MNEFIHSAAFPDPLPRAVPVAGDPVGEGLAGPLPLGLTAQVGSPGNGQDHVILTTAHVRTINSGIAVVTRNRAHRVVRRLCLS